MLLGADAKEFCKKMTSESSASTVLQAQCAGVQGDANAAALFCLAGDRCRWHFSILSSSFPSPSLSFFPPYSLFPSSFLSLFFFLLEGIGVFLLNK